MIRPEETHRIIKDIIRIRYVEQFFLDLFSAGKLNGTVHTCIGQELSAIAFASQLKKSDFIFSNHRCHGHFIAYTKDWKGLILELLGSKNGICGGIGSSQHLHKYNFFSNGIQGGTVPIAAGFALANKLHNKGSIGIVFIGDGTMGEGVVYETLNFISKHSIPLLIVCENNMYAQSTPIQNSMAGNIKDRIKAFDIEFRISDTFNQDLNIIEEAKSSIEYVRNKTKPIFHLVNTYRLKAHSKGDDNRDPNEILQYEKKDFLNNFQELNPDYFKLISDQITNEIQLFYSSIDDIIETSIQDFLEISNKTEVTIEYKDYIFSKEKQVKELNDYFNDLIEDEKVIFIGEDILDPYGGAFKVTKGLSTRFPKRVISTSISEGLIAGLANGLALNGFKPYAEIMFGDFSTLCFDQFLNHSSKIYNMYNKQISCPVVFRTPMGGRRGYGPTHSQSIEKHFVGMDTFEILTLNRFMSPKIVYNYVNKRKHPTLVIENKIDYGKKIYYNLPENYNILISNEEIPNLIIKPTSSNNISTTIITYGGASDLISECVEKLFYDYDELVQILILTKIDPLPINFISENIKNGMRVITFEEGTKRGSIGNNIVSFLAERFNNLIFNLITSEDIIIPSSQNLENEVLVNVESVYKKLKD